MNVVDTLQMLSQPVLNMSTCIEAYKYKKLPFAFSYKNLCVGGEMDKDSCKGDSGGPFQIPFRGKVFQRGIVSEGHIRCGSKGFPAIYVNVDYYVKWILDNIYP